MAVIDNTDNPGTGGDNPGTGGDNPATTQPDTTDNEAVEVCESLLQQILDELKKLNKLFGGN